MCFDVLLCCIAEYLMTWFKDRVMRTRLRLFRDMLAAMYTPMATKPSIVFGVLQHVCFERAHAA